MRDTVARVYPSRTPGVGMLTASGPCKYPYVRLGEGKVHRVRGVLIRWRRPDDYAHLPAVSIGPPCRLGWDADHPRLRLLRTEDLPDDADQFCRRCFGWKAQVMVVPRKMAA